MKTVQSRQSARQAVKTLLSMLLILIGVLLLMSLLAQFLPRLMECGLFGMHPALDTLVGMAACCPWSVLSSFQWSMV